jgi:hypothetical protein
MTIKNDINALIEQPARLRESLQISSKPAIGARVGVGEFQSAQQPGSPATVPGNMTEVIQVYSNILLTEDGAHEMPQNWPTDGEYIYLAPPQDPGFEIDVDEAVYIQRRVHATFFLQNDRLIEQYYLIQIEKPYTGLFGIINTINAISTVIIPMAAAWKMPASAIGQELVSKKLAELGALGITL